MKFLTQTLALAALFIATATFAQDEERPNLIGNADFEEGDVSALKKPGMIDMCDGWRTVTDAIPDYFSAGIKSEKVNVPKNIYGEQEALSGDRYVGIRTYTKDAKKHRTYIQTTLKKPMVKNQQYCVKFNVSLADMSKYASNNISAFINRSRMKQSNTAEVLKDAQITLEGNPVINDTEGWTTICGSYFAKGGETTLVIGSFVRNDEMTVEKLPRPNDMTEPQIYQAYYYVDDIEVTQVKSKAECTCGDSEPKEEIIYSKTTPITPDMSTFDILTASTAYFPELGSKVSPISERSLKNVVKALNDNPGVSIELVGHTDNNEAEAARSKPKYVGLGLKRAEAVKRYLVAKGIDEGRIRVASKDNSQPATKRTTPLSMAQNRRVAMRVM